MEENVTGVEDVLQQLSNMEMDGRKKSKIIEAGARVVEKELKVAAKEAGYNSNLPNMLIYSDGRKYVIKGHFSDYVTHKPHQYADGSTDVGFSRQGVAVAHWVNNGTYRQNGQHFMEALGAEDHDEAFEMMVEKSKEVLGGE